MNKHTAGPWAIKREEGDINITSQSRPYVAQIYGALCSGTDEVQEANARLIAAAPKLLASIKDLAMELAQLHALHYPACEHNCPSREYVANARALIDRIEKPASRRDNDEHRVATVEETREGNRT